MSFGFDDRPVGRSGVHAPDGERSDHALLASEDDDSDANAGRARDAFVTIVRSVYAVRRIGGRPSGTLGDGSAPARRRSKKSAGLPPHAPGNTASRWRFACGAGPRRAESFRPDAPDRPGRHQAQGLGPRALFAGGALALLAALPATAAAECELRETSGPITVESCPVENADYPVVRGEMTVRGSMSAVVALLTDADACPEWQAMCVEERAAPLDAPYRTLRQRVSGKGMSRRVTMDRAAWWRTADGGVVGDMVGADDLTPEFEGKRVLCVRTRWFLMPGEDEGTITVVQKGASDPQPPFGLGARVVTPRIAKTVLETFANLRNRLASGQHGPGPEVESLPMLERELPGVGEDFARCQAARR